MFGKNVTSIVRQSDGTYDISGHTSQHDTGAQSPQKFKINCNYVIGADGASSFVRKHLNVDLLGEKDIHTLMNIHFSIRNKIIMNRPAMLYFVYNEVCRKSRDCYYY
jgi:2-polyprenyl-6-methoxyphenol hydroxylase-like FAD-dependent oxidoreductase